MLGVVIPDIFIVGSVPLAVALVGWVGRLQLKATRFARDDAVDAVKDDLIATLEHNHEALADRVEILEKRLTEADARGDRLEQELAAKTADFETMKQYAAPDAVERLEALAVNNADLLGDVLARLTEAVTLLRDVLARLGSADRP